MRRALAALVIVIAVGAAAYTQWRAGTVPATVAKTEAEQRVLDVLQEMRREGRIHLEVPEADGRMLRVLAEAIDAQQVVEVGTSTGYSALWMAMALRNTGGRLTTFEIDPGRAAQARQHFQQAGVDDIVTVVEGNAHETLTRINGPVDLVFLDAEKEGYVAYLERLLPLVRPGGLVLAHNTGMVPDYIRAVRENSALDTVLYTEGAGLSISVKKR